MSGCCCLLLCDLIAVVDCHEVHLGYLCTSTVATLCAIAAGATGAQVLLLCIMNIIEINVLVINNIKHCIIFKRTFFAGMYSQLNALYEM